MTFCALWCFALLLQTPSPHTAHPRSPDKPEEELYRLVSSGDFIAVGRVTHTDPVGKRLTDEEWRSLDDLSKTLGGTMYTFHVEALLCARTDLTPGISRPKIAGTDLYIFKLRFAPFYEQEHYAEGQRYLIVLVPVANLDKLSKEYKLKESITYYEAFEQDRGLIPLAEGNLTLLNKLNIFCKALAPIESRRKIRALRSLSASSDVELRKSAQKAIAHIQSMRPHY